VRKYLLLMLIIMFFSISSNATSTLIFAGDDYEVQVVVSDTTPEQIVTVNFGGPDQTGLISIMPGDFAKLSIDCEKQKLILVFNNPGDSKLPPSFKLRAIKDRAYIKIGGSKIKLKGDWIR